MIRKHHSTIAPLLVIALLAFFGLVAAGCGDSDKSDDATTPAAQSDQPEPVDGDAAGPVVEAIEGQMAAVWNGDSATACKLMTDSYLTQNFVDFDAKKDNCETVVSAFAKAEGSELDPESVEVTDVTVLDKEADAKVTYTLTTNGKDETYKNEPRHLVLVDDSWKLDGEKATK